MNILQASRMCKQIYQVKEEIGSGDVLSDPAITFKKFVKVDEDTAVCGKFTDLGIIFEVKNNNQADENPSHDDRRTFYGSGNIPSATEASNHIQTLR